MFKEYKLAWKDSKGSDHSIDFFVHSRKTRNGFLHEACFLGTPPRLDGIDARYGDYHDNEDKLFKARYTKVSFCNRTWESWPGQDCLKRAWGKLEKLKFLDMSEVYKGNPFGDDKEPEHEDLWEPDDLFGRFTQK